MLDGLDSENIQRIGHRQCQRFTNFGKRHDPVFCCDILGDDLNDRGVDLKAGNLDQRNAEAFA